MQNKYVILRKDNKLRLFYKGVELENVVAWEARHPDFHNITFTVDGSYVELSIDKEQISEQTTEEFLVEEILQKDQIITELQREILRLRRNYGHDA